MRILFDSSLSYILLKQRLVAVFEYDYIIPNVSWVNTISRPVIGAFSLQPPVYVHTAVTSRKTMLSFTFTLNNYDLSCCCYTITSKHAHSYHEKRVTLPRSYPCTCVRACVHVCTFYYCVTLHVLCFLLHCFAPACTNQIFRTEKQDKQLEGNHVAKEKNAGKKHCRTQTLDFKCKISYFQLSARVPYK